jgi:hypothetical protein
MPTDSLSFATKKELYEKAGNRIWDIKVLYDINRSKISKWLEEHAQRELAGFGTETELNKAKILEKAINYYPLTLSAELDSFRNSAAGFDYKRLKRAEDGTLERSAPTLATIWFFWFLILCLTGGLELSFFSYMVFFKGGGPALIGIAILLLVGGLFAGAGFSSIMLHRHISEEKCEQKHIFQIAIGIALILGSVSVRAVFGGALAAIVAMFFGIAITTAETYWAYSKKARKHYLEEMFSAQQYYAESQHNKDMGERGNHADDTWFPIYQGIIQKITKVIITATTSQVKS